MLKSTKSTSEREEALHCSAPAAAAEEAAYNNDTSPKTLPPNPPPVGSPEAVRLQPRRLCWKVCGFCGSEPATPTPVRQGKTISGKLARR